MAGRDDQPFLFLFFHFVAEGRSFRGARASTPVSIAATARFSGGHKNHLYDFGETGSNMQM